MEEVAISGMRIFPAMIPPPSVLATFGSTYTFKTHPLKSDAPSGNVNVQPVIPASLFFNTSDEESVLERVLSCATSTNGSINRPLKKPSVA